MRRAAGSLNDTVAGLRSIVGETRAAGSNNGLFAAMYGSVTVRTRDAVRTGGFFDDDARMADLAVLFAGRYLDAHRRHTEGAPTTESWQIAFQIADAPTRRMILQHLLLGMNAHINLDLGVAVARVAATGRLASMYRDFLRINEMLYQMVDGLQEDLGSISPRMWLVDRVGGGWDEGFMRLGIRKARDLSWRLAERLTSAEPEEWSAIIAGRDRETAAVARTIVRPWSPIDLVGRRVATAEPDDVAEAIDVFDHGGLDLGTVEAAVAAEADLEVRPDEPLSAVRLLRR